MKARRKRFEFALQRVFSPAKRGKNGKLKFELRTLENEIDALVYRLYELTAEEIAIVEGKAQAF